MNNPAVSFELTGVVPSVCDAEAGACPDDRVAAGAHIVTRNDGGEALRTGHGDRSAVAVTLTD